MKLTTLQALKINSTLILVSLLLIVTLNSCGKNDLNIGPAQISFIHASPGLPPVDFYINGIRINGDSIVPYTDTIPYKFIGSGSLNITVKKHISSIIYISKAIDLEPDKKYSFFVAGKPDSVSYLLTEDNFVAPTTGKAKLRFLNLSPGSQPLDLKLTSSSALFTGQAFKSYTDFASIDPGTYTIGIYEPGTSTAIAQQSLEVEAGPFYSVWARGLKDSSDPATALSMQVISLK